MGSLATLCRATIHRLRDDFYRQSFITFNALDRIFAISGVMPTNLGASLASFYQPKHNPLGKEKRDFRLDTTGHVGYLLLSGSLETLRSGRRMMFAIKADVREPLAKALAFSAQKTMYGGKDIAEGNTIFVFASENEGGPGLIASGVVTSAEAIAKERGIARQTPRVSITIRRIAFAKRRLGRSELKPFTDWDNGRPETELNFKFYRQATNKIIGISDESGAFLRGFF